MGKGKVEDVVETETIEEPEPVVGEGTFNFPDNTKYTGQWIEIDGVKSRHGQGSFTFLSSKTTAGCDEIYTGDWEMDMMTGQGSYTFASGNKYKGGFKNNSFEGQGEYLYTDGASYVGQWHNNKMHGKGVYTDSNDVKCSGEFFNGMYNSGRSYISLRPS